LSSDTGNTVPRLAIETFGSSIDAVVLTSLTNALKLVTWPEEQEVSFIATAQNADVSDPSRGQRAYVSGVGSQQLVDRWYALKLLALPVGFSWANNMLHTNSKDGSVASRFRPGSDPVLMSIRLCQKTGQDVVALDFSERVRSSIPYANLIQVKSGSTNASCTAVEPASLSEGDTTIFVSCSPLTRSATLSVSVAASALSSLSGNAVHDFGATSIASHIVAPSSMGSWGDGCLIAHL